MVLTLEVVNILRKDLIYTFLFSLVRKTKTQELIDRTVHLYTIEKNKVKLVQGCLLTRKIDSQTVQQLNQRTGLL